LELGRGMKQKRGMVAGKKMKGKKKAKKRLVKGKGVPQERPREPVDSECRASKKRQGPESSTPLLEAHS